MPMLRDDESRAGVLMAAVNHVLAEDGPAGLSLRRVSAVCGVTPSSMLHHLGSKRRLLILSAARAGAERTALIQQRVPLEGAHAFLPRDEDDVRDLRPWVAWQEVARTDRDLATVLLRARHDERALLSRSLQRQWPADALEELHVLLEGLTLGLSRLVEPLSPERARSILDRHLATGARPATEEAGPPARSSG